jgi:hypothetical protein
VGWLLGEVAIDNVGFHHNYIFIKNGRRVGGVGLGGVIFYIPPAIPDVPTLFP